MTYVRGGKQGERGALEASGGIPSVPTVHAPWTKTSKPTVSFSTLIPLGLFVAFDIIQLPFFLKIIFSLDLIHTEFDH